MNYIEQLLAKIEQAEERQQFQTLAEKYATDWIVDPAVRARTEEISQWADKEWDYDHGMSKLEYQQAQELAALKASTSNKEANKGMELNELNDYLAKYTKDQGLMTKAEVEAQIKAKEDAFNNELNLISTLTSRVSYLNAKYQKDFGDMFDPDEFVTKANEKGYARLGKQGLDQYYEEFTAEKRQAKSEADLQAKLAEAEERGRKKALEERGMGGNQGAGPDIGGSPELSHFQQKIMGLNKPIDPTQSSAPADAELGRGTIARFAALAADRRDREAVH